MNKQDKKVPTLRFKGFTNDWEQRKLGEIGIIKSGIGFPTSQQGGAEGTPFYKVSDMNKPGNELVMKSSSNYVSNRQINDNHWKPIEKTPAVIFAKVGAALMLNRKRLVNQSFLIDNNTMSYSFSNSWDTIFGYTLFLTLNLPKYAQTGALPSFNAKDIQNIKVSLPLKNEQHAIGELMAKVSNIVTLQQRKLDLLKQLKKGLLQKMFADKGSKRPILRFEGFSNDWEQRKLGEISSTFSGGTPSASNKNYYGGEIPFIRSAEINQNSTQLYLTKDGLNNSSAKLVKKGTLLYALYGATSGEVGIAQIDGAINQAIMAIDLNNEDTYFVKSWLEKNKGRIISTYLQGGQGNLSAKLIKKLVISLPKIKEQIQISSLISRIDILLTLQQRKITKYNEIKKSLLQQMFI